MYVLFSIGFHVSEVAHDFVLQLKNWIITKGILNSFDSWHGKLFRSIAICSYIIMLSLVTCCIAL